MKDYERSTPPAVKVTDLGKKYRKNQVLEAVNFEAMSGECIAIVGRNGCGKSTLLRILAGVLPADAGTVQYFGTTTGKSSKICRKYCGYVPQENPLLEELSVKDNLKFWSRGEKTNLEKIIQRFELNDILRVKVEKLSGGMKRRLAIACALLELPPVVLLDEPTAALDIYYKNNTLAWMEEYCKMKGTIIMASHEEQEIVFADRCMMLHEGKIRELSRDKQERVCQIREYLCNQNTGGKYGNEV